MNKLISSIKHPHHPQERAEIFLSNLKDSPNEPIKLELDDLTELELKSYTSWWKDLDPFDIGQASNERVFEFISTCGLSDEILEQIIALFQDQKDGIDKEQFFAMLRLIAHAQKGRKVNKDLIFLGAPLPVFDKTASKLVLPHNTHSRSKSVPQNYFSDIVNKPQHVKGKRSIDQDSLQELKATEGKGLLLTQGFTPTIPLNDSTDSLDKRHYNPYKNPFETDDSNSTTPSESPFIKPNLKCNSDFIPPPPVPPQSTKPPHPKYATR